MYFLHAINSDRQTRMLNVLGQIAMILGDKKKSAKLYVTNSLLSCHLKLTALNTPRLYVAANRFQADKLRLHQTIHLYKVRRLDNLNAKSF